MKIVVPHFNKSVEATKNDARKILDLAIQMIELCHQLETERKVKEAFALAHCQIEEIDPLRFFVFNTYNKRITDKRGVEEAEVIINPQIITHTKTSIQKIEGCLSFIGWGGSAVERWSKIKVKYQELRLDNNNNPYISDEITKDLSGLEAEIFQHEIDHFNAKYIYPKKMIDTFLEHNK